MRLTHRSPHSAMRLTHHSPYSGHTIVISLCYILPDTYVPASGNQTIIAILCLIINLCARSNLQRPGPVPWKSFSSGSKCDKLCGFVKSIPQQSIRKCRTALHHDIATSEHLDLRSETLPSSINNSLHTDNQTENEKLDSYRKNLNNLAAFSCMHCSFKAPRKLDFKMHLKTKQQETKISCSFCNLLPGYKSNQIRKHTDPDKFKVFTCEYCSYSTKLACSFSLHMKKA